MRQGARSRPLHRLDKMVIRDAARLRGNKTMTIRDEGDFIRQVKHRYHRKLNNAMATRIQATVKGWMTRRWYLQYKLQKLFVIGKIQAIFKAKLYSRTYKKIIAIRKQRSALLLQRYSRGWLVHKKYQDMLHRRVIDRMMDQFQIYKEQIATDMQIKLRFLLKLKKRRKLIKEQKKAKKAEADKNKRFGGRGARRSTNTSTARPTPAPAVSKPPPKQTPAKLQTTNTSKSEAVSPEKLMKQPTVVEAKTALPTAEQLASAATMKSPSPEKREPENVKENSEGLIDVQVSKMLDDPVDSSAHGSKTELPGI